ncbi:MAG TPA: triacylglycerol lipase [Myxococcota bacterium]
MTSRVYLIPGFFGFAHFGDLKYFHHVEELLTHELAGLGRKFEVIRVDTLAAGTLARRTARLREVLVQTAAGDTDPIHLVGHSTGALDARRLLDPERARAADDDVVKRVKSVVSIAGAHGGTPLAATFRTAFGKDLLRILGALTVQTLRLGPISVGTAMAIAGALSMVDRVVGAKKDLIDQIEESILTDFTPERRATLEAFFSELSVDQGLLDELSPELARHFDAQTRDRDGVAYGCVVAMSKTPTVQTALSLGLSPYAQASHAVFHAIWNITSRFAAENGVPASAIDAQRKLYEQLGRMPSDKDNDGIVPTLAQFHGRLIRAVSADHHDVIGHFEDPAHDPPHIDWLISRSGFRRPQFDQLWRDIARFIVEADGGDPIA